MIFVSSAIFVLASSVAVPCTDPSCLPSKRPPSLVGTPCNGALCKGAASAGGGATGDPPRSCPRDTRVCPDGRKVGRDPQTCQFLPCPSDTSHFTNTKTAEATATRTSIDDGDGTRTKTVTRTAVNTFTRTRIETETATETRVDTSKIGEGSSQSLSFCNAAAMGTLSSVLHLDEGKKRNAIEAYARAQEQVSRARGLDGSCPASSMDSTLFDQDSVSSMTARFEDISGLKRGDILGHVSDMAKLAAGGGAATPAAGLLGFLGSFTDAENQERLSKVLEGEEAESEAGAFAAPADRMLGDDSASADINPSVAKAAVTSPVATAVETASETKPSPPVPMTREQKEILLRKERIVEEHREKELNELASIMDSSTRASSDDFKELETFSIFERISRRYRLLTPRMLKPRVTGLEPKKP